MTAPNEPTPAASATPAEPQADDQQNPAERRINQLFARAKTAEERVQSLESSQQEFQAKLLELQQENTMLRGGAQGQPAPDQLSSAGPAMDPNLAGATPFSGSTDVVATLRKEIRDAIGTVRDELKVEKAVTQLKEGQRKSLGIAQREFPELQDPNSKLYQLTDQILTSDRELQLHAHGPYKAALMARGILGDNSPDVTEQQRAAASVPHSTGAVSPGGKQAEVAELEEKLKTLTADMRASKGDPAALWREFHQAKIRLGQLAGKDIDQREQKSF